MARLVLRTGKNAGAIMNTANEVAVEYYLNRKITFGHIFDVVEEMLQKEKIFPIDSLCDIEGTMEQTREHTAAYIEKEVMK